MIPLERLPGQGRWSGAAEALLAHPGPLWVYGDTGTGVSTVGAWLASQRRAPFLDDAEHRGGAALEAWIAAHPRGILGAHLEPEAPALAGAGARCLAFRLLALEDDPRCVAGCVQALAAAEGAAEPLPAALAALPCPGNLTGLRNRVVRWNLLGQLPEPAAAGAEGASLPLASEDMAANLHVLERLLLHRALRRSYGNRVEAASRLGVSRRQLYLLIARHGDPVRGDPPSSEGPKRLLKQRPANSRIPPGR